MRRIFASFALVLILSAAALGWYGSGQAARFVAHHTVVTRRPLGMFEWRGVASLESDVGYATTLAKLHHQGYDTIFVAYDAAQAAVDTQRYRQDLDAFSTLAGRADMQMALVAGDPSWAAAAHYPDVARVLTFVQGYNSSFATPIAAVQFDIEPYDAGASTHATAQSLINVAHFVAAQPASKSLHIGYAVPFWLTDDVHDTQALARAVAATSGGFLTIMDYRVSVSGSDGSIAHAAPFFALASGQRLDIYIGQDATRESPAKTTFYVHPAFDLRLAQYRLDQAERRQPNYAGQMVNDVQALERLK